MPPSPWNSSKELDILHHLQVGFPWLGGSSYWSSSYNNSYLSKRGTRWLFYLPFQLLIFMISSKKIPQLSLPDKILNLLLQVIAFIHVMLVISIEAVIFVLFALIRISLHLLWPLQGWVILDLHQYLIKWNFQGCVMLTSS